MVAKDKAGVHADAVAVVDIKNADDLTPLYEIVRTSMTIKVNGEKAMRPTMLMVPHI